MELQVLAAFCYWIVLPLSLLAGCLFRYNVLSLVYLLYLLLLPWFLGPSEHSMKGHTGRLLKALLGTSILFIIAHVTFQVCLRMVPSLDLMLGFNCTTWDTLARHIGVSRLNFSDIPNTIRLLVPDLGVFLISAVSLGLCIRLIPKTPSQSGESREPLKQEEEEEPTDQHETYCEENEEEDEEESVAPQQAAQLTARLRVTADRLLKALGKSLAIVLLALAGITLPSAFSGVYYLLFIGVCTWWACHFPVSHMGFNAVCVMVAFFAGGHLICLYSYQTPFIQQMFPPESIWARVFGLKDIIRQTNCTSQDEMILNMSHEWPVYVNPGIVLLLYFTITSLLKLRKWNVPGLKEGSGTVQSELELTPLEGNSTTEEAKPMLFLSNKAPGEVSEDSIVHVMADPTQGGLDQEKPERHEESSPLHTLSHAVMKQSYICALIAMMVWSITYHSWLTFVLLLWACLIWIVRNRRHFAMLCSPFILLYGLSLCSLQYVWGMDLEPELPTKIGFMSLAQLGLVRTQYPCLNLGAMLLYTLTFWLLLRQFVQEKLLKKRESAAVLMEVSVPETDQSRQQSLLKVLGELVMGFYAKYWIYVCAGMFIVVSFAGRLVVYKIVYMLLFLLCLNLFQVYYTLWRKLLKVFWWLVVAYTMLVLIAVYTFQFEDFPIYWRNWTQFTDAQLGDLGLEQFSVSELFSSILIPGFFLLACILQLHYCHRPFMHLTDLARIPAAEDNHLHRDDHMTRGQILGELKTDASPEEGGNEDASSTDKATPSKWGLVAERLTVLLRKFSDTLHRLQVFLWRLLELHILKLVALYTVWVALQEVSVMNFLLVVLWALATPFSRFRHMASCLSTIWVSIIIVCKMLYQLNIVNPEEYSTNCTQPYPNSTNMEGEEILNSTLFRGPIDPANWFGIRKGFPNLGYIQNHLQILMILIFEAIVYRHQEYYRSRYQLLQPVPDTVFKDVSHEQLDRGPVQLHSILH